MWIAKYIASVIAIYTTLLYISNLIVSFNSSPYKFNPDGEELKDDSKLHAIFRLVIGLIMSLSWAAVIVL